MKIAILGDSHDHYENLETAITRANSAQCALLLHTGDLGAPGKSLDILLQFNGPIKMILGNNDHEIVGIMRRMKEAKNFELVKTSNGGDVYEDVVDGVRIFMHHYPRMAELASLSGEYDVCIHGHTHQYRSEIIGNTLLINPSSVQPSPDGASMVIFDTTTRTHERILL